MTQLTPEARSLLERARSARDPAPEQLARVRAGLVSRLGRGAFDTRLPSASPGWGATWTRARMAKTMVGLAMAIGVGVLLESFISAPDVDSESGAPFAAAGLQATVSTSTPAKGSMDIPLDILEVPAVSRVEQDVAAKRVTPSAAKSNPTTTIASSRSEGGIAEELKILVRAHTALRGRRPDEALAALDEHESRFPNGALSEERASQRVFALCAAGRTSEARSAAERFLAVYPKSPMAARVRSSCAGDGPFSHGQ